MQTESKNESVYIPSCPAKVQSESKRESKDENTLFAIATLQKPDTKAPRFGKLPRFLTLGGTETMLTNYKRDEQYVIIADSVDRKRLTDI